MLWLLIAIGLICPDGVSAAYSEQLGNMTDTPPAVNNTQSSAENSTAATQSSASSSADENNTQSTGQNATSQTQQNSTEPSGQNITDTESQNSTDAFGHNFTDSAYVTSTDTVKTNNTENVIDDQITEKDSQTGADIDITTEPLNTTRTVTETEDTRAENSTVPANTTDLSTTTQPFIQNTSWMKTFLSINRFDGWYMYNGGQFLFDFVPRFVHPTSSQTLVATFYDEDGAVIDMNGTSSDGLIVIFTSTTVFSQSYRFSKDLVFQLTGSISNKRDNSVYSGTITLPQNSSFGRFHMQKGIEKESIDEENSKTATIIAVVACLSFLFIVGTAAFVCWAAKKGYLEKQHKHYRLFKDSAVTYETDAETVHI